SIALSLIPGQLFENLLTSKTFFGALESVFKTFTKMFPMNTSAQPPTSLSDIKDKLNNTITFGAPLHPTAKAVIWVALCRAASLSTRLIASLHPVPLSIAETQNKQQLNNSFYPLRFWAEVWVAHRQTWLSMDVCMTSFNKPLELEPSNRNRREVFSYIVAFDQSKKNIQKKKIGN
ncbi:hypothetical protein HK096_010327, partial [Nowakowskiella sp. JEL0078]